MLPCLAAPPLLLIPCLGALEGHPCTLALICKSKTKGKTRQSQPGRITGDHEFSIDTTKVGSCTLLRSTDKNHDTPKLHRLFYSVNWSLQFAALLLILQCKKNCLFLILDVREFSWTCHSPVRNDAERQRDELCPYAVAQLSRCQFLSCTHNGPCQHAILQNLGLTAHQIDTVCPW